MGESGGLLCFEGDRSDADPPPPDAAASFSCLFTASSCEILPLIHEGKRGATTQQKKYGGKMRGGCRAGGQATNLVLQTGDSSVQKGLVLYNQNQINQTKTNQAIQLLLFKSSQLRIPYTSKTPQPAST